MLHLMNKSNPMLITYIKNKKNERIGAVVAIDAEKIGWSLCCKKDRFDRDMALSIAFGRAHGSNAELPREIKPVFNQMRERSRRYFKIKGVDMPSRAGLLA